MGRRRKKKYDAYLSSNTHIRAYTKAGAKRQAAKRLRVRKS